MTQKLYNSDLCSQYQFLTQKFSGRNTDGPLTNFLLKPVKLAWSQIAGGKHREQFFAQTPTAKMEDQ